VVVQRVTEAGVTVDGEVIARIAAGVCVFVAAGTGDVPRDAEHLADKVAHLRIFEDASGKMNVSLSEIGGEALIVSEFTLYGDCRQGRRPSFSRALPPGQAETLYNCFADKMRALGIRVSTGKFRSAMRVRLTNDGPVTLILDSPS